MEKTVFFSEDYFTQMGAMKKTWWGFLLGLVSALAMAPFYVMPVLFFTFSGLFWLVDGTKSRINALFIGWFFATGYFVGGLYWIGNALLMAGDQYQWMVPFAVAGLPMLLGLFYALAVLFYKISFGREEYRVLGFIAFWGAAEWVRGHVFTGFPWNSLGYTWGFSTEILQMVTHVGLYGLGAITLLVATIPVLAGGFKKSSGWVLIALIVGGMWVSGRTRLEDAPEHYVDGISLRLVQVNIDQKDKGDRAQADKIFRRYVEWSRSPARMKDTQLFLIWPETALPYRFEEGASLQSVADYFIPDQGLLFAGAVRQQGGNFYNSLIVIDGEGQLVEKYDKFHLVPFGEYVPLKSMIGRFVDIQNVTQGSVDFTPGDGVRTLNVPGLPALSPLICYEIIFPGMVARADDRPAWILNITNDGWYGYSSGPFQHFLAARVRAIEEGLPVVRAAGTGISGVIDGFGRVVAQIDLHEAGMVDSYLPQAVEMAPLSQREKDKRMLWMLIAFFSLPQLKVLISYIKGQNRQG